MMGLCLQVFSAIADVSALMETHVREHGGAPAPTCAHCAALREVYDELLERLFADCDVN